MPELARKARKLLRLYANPRWRHAARKHHVAATTEHRDLAGALSPRTVFDIGAHHGQFALLAKELWPDARIICFEPNPVAFAILREVMGADAECHHWAIGSQTGQMALNIHTRDMTSSFLVPEADHCARADSWPTGRRVTCAIQPLTETMMTDLLGPILLKIDAQGYELEVLKGAKDILHRIDAIYVECAWQRMYHQQPLAYEIIDWLRTRDFVVTGTGDGNKYETNLLFRPLGDHDG